jgi:hypothetical protein
MLGMAGEQVMARAPAPQLESVSRLKIQSLEGYLLLFPYENLLLRMNLSIEEVSRRLDEVFGELRGLNPLAGRLEL